MQVAKWGNSLAVRIPKQVAESLNINEGDDIEFILDDNNSFKIRKTLSKSEALKDLASMNIVLPKDYKFDRDEANE